MKRYMIKGVDEKFQGHEGFQYPMRGYVEAPDYHPIPLCENGIFGIDEDYYDWNIVNEYYLVIEYDCERIVIRNEKIKIKGGNVVFFSRHIHKIQAWLNKRGIPYHGYKSINTGGNLSTNIGADHSTNTGGDYSNNIGGEHSSNTGGNFSNNTGGNSSTNTGGYKSTNRGKDYSTNTGKNHSTNIGGDNSNNTGGHFSNNIGENSSKNTGGDYSNNTGGHCSKNIGGEFSINTINSHIGYVCAGEGSIIIMRFGSIITTKKVTKRMANKILECRLVDGKIQVRRV